MEIARNTYSIKVNSVIPTNYIDLFRKLYIMDNCEYRTI